ncbi:MAG: hypothetical protein V2A54_01225 [Bacteroidota bacterium]
MKVKVFLMTLTVSAALFQSCKKDNETVITPTPAPEESTDYSNLSIGNYWVYQRFDVDGSGNAIASNVYDSCYVEKDTTINSNTYFKVIRPVPYGSAASYSYQRDSSNYLVNSHGDILFSPKDFTTVFSSKYMVINISDTVCNIMRMMADKDQTYSTPSGNYTTSNCKETYSMYPNYSNGGTLRYKNNRYAANVGLVIETLPFFANSPNSIERRLVRFHVN